MKMVSSSFPGIQSILFYSAHNFATKVSLSHKCQCTTVIMLVWS